MADFAAQSMVMPRSVLLLLFVPLVQVGCAYPVGSRARPAKALSEGQLAVGAGGLVPLGFIGELDFPGYEGTTVSQNEAGTFIPVGSFDYAIGDGELAGVDVSYAQFFAGNLKTLVVNPRFEYPFGGLERNLALTLDANLMVFSGERDGPSAIPFLQPMLGLRGYIDLDYFGITISQSIGTTIITLYAPGGISFDIPIPFGEGGPKLHIMPEFRWDPTLIVATAKFIMFSAGGAIMLEF